MLICRSTQQLGNMLSGQTQLQKVLAVARTTEPIIRDPMRHPLDRIPEQQRQHPPPFHRGASRVSRSAVTPEADAALAVPPRTTGGLLSKRRSTRSVISSSSRSQSAVRPLFPSIKGAAPAWAGRRRAKKRGGQAPKSLMFSVGASGAQQAAGNV